MKNTISSFKRIAFALFAAFLLSTSAVNAQFSNFPPGNVSNSQDQNQMIWQLGLSYPTLASKLQDPNAPSDAYPANAPDPGGNWTNAVGHTITRSGAWLVE